MTTYIAFLRAINVAGHPSVRMEALKAAFSAAGCANVRSYIQSGNVVFDCAEKQAAAIFKKIEARLRPLVGGEPTILFRRVDDLDRLVKANPFGARAKEKTLTSSLICKGRSNRT